MEEKEGSAGCDLKGQEDLGGNEAGSKDEDSETDYSSEDEEILTKAGRPMLNIPDGAGSGWMHAPRLCRRLCSLRCWPLLSLSNSLDVLNCRCVGCLFFASGCLFLPPQRHTVLALLQLAYLLIQLR